MTRFGMREKDFQALAPLMAEAVRGKKVKEEIAKFRQKFLKLGYCFEVKDLEPLKQQLLATF